MKKIILMLITAVTLSVMTVSESQAQVKFNMGLRLGFNASTVTGDKTFSGENYKFVPGIHIGPYFRVGFKDKYRISTDILFSTKGAAQKFTITDANGNAISSDTYYAIPFYIDIPILFNYKPVAGLYIEAGVQPSIALTQLNYSSNTDSDFDKTGLKSTDFAPVAGIGYEFKKVSLGVRSVFGVTNINDNPYPAFYNPVNKNFTLMATFGFKFI